jgi:hypothetical protein
MRPARDGSEMRKLRSGRGYAADHVVAEFRRQPGLADFPGDAEPAENLHRSRRDLVAFDVRRLAGAAGFRHRHVDAARGKVHRQRQPDRACSNDQDAGVIGSLHRRIRCRPSSTRRLWHLGARNGKEKRRSAGAIVAAAGGFPQNMLGCRKIPGGMP